MRRLQERMRRIDGQVMSEALTARLIMEAMDEEDLNKVSQIIDKLRSLKGKGLDALDTAIDQAEAELNKYTGGGSITKAWGKLKGKVGIDNPVVKIMTMADALEQGFKQLPIILKNNIGSPEQLKAQADKSINDIVTDETKKKTLLANIVKAVSPKGIFGSFKKIPYLDREKFANNVAFVKLSDLAPLVKLGASGASPQEVAGDLKDTATKGGDVQTKGTAPGEPAKGTAQTAAAGAPAKPGAETTSTAAAGEAPPGETRGGGAPAKPTSKGKLEDDHVKAMAQDFAKKAGVDAQSAYKVMTALNNNEKLKEAFLRSFKS